MAIKPEYNRLTH